MSGLYILLLYCYLCKEAAKVPTLEAAKASEKEVEDEVVPDSKYRLMTPSIDNSKTVENPAEEPPPPERDCTLGVIENEYR